MTTTYDILCDAINTVEQAMGAGAAERHPQIVAAVVMGEMLSYMVPRLCDALRTDHPLQGETLQGVASALDEVARAIRAKG